MPFTDTPDGQTHYGCVSCGYETGHSPVCSKYKPVPPPPIEKVKKFKTDSLYANEAWLAEQERKMGRILESDFEIEYKKSNKNQKLKKHQNWKDRLYKIFFGI